MKVLESSYANLTPGQVIELTGRDLADVSYVKTKDIKWKVDEDRRSEAESYSQFSVGGRSFTIQNIHATEIELLKDPKRRKEVAALRLQAAEYDRPVLDPDTNEPTGDTVPVKSFTFISLVTVEDSFAYIQNEGKLAQEEQKYAPKTTAVGQAEIDKAVAKSMDTFMDKFMAKYAKTATPAGEETV